MDGNATLESLWALMNTEPEIADGFLFGAIYYRSIKLGRSPRDIADALFKALPDSKSWPEMEQSLLCFLEAAEASDDLDAPA